jgi:glutamate-1-semialdehyde aminotransferase
MRLQEPARYAEWQAIDATRQQAREAQIRAGIRIVQITGAKSRMSSLIMDDKVQFFEEALRSRHPQARHVLASNSGHGISVTDSALMTREVSRLLLEVSQGAY